MQLINLPPDVLEVPPVRLTSYMPSDMQADFRSSVQSRGVRESLSIGLELPPELQEQITDDQLLTVTHPIPGAHYWIINGKNRTEEALVRGDETLPCNVSLMTYRDVVYDNLMTTGLQGKTKNSEWRRVIRWLEEEEGLDSIEIRKKTGLGQALVENLQWINRAVEEVQEAVDVEVLGVGKAVMIARIEDRDVQVRVLYACLDNNMTEPALREHIRLVQQMLSGEIAPPTIVPRQTDPPVTCTYCRTDVPVSHSTQAIMCPSCAQAAYEAVHASRSAASPSA